MYSKYKRRKQQLRLLIPTFSGSWPRERSALAHLERSSSGAVAGGVCVFCLCTNSTCAHARVQRAAAAGTGGGGDGQARAAGLQLHCALAGCGDATSCLCNKDVKTSSANAVFGTCSSLVRGLRWLCAQAVFPSLPAHRLRLRSHFFFARRGALTAASGLLRTAASSKQDKLPTQQQARPTAHSRSCWPRPHRPRPCVPVRVPCGERGVR